MPSWQTTDPAPVLLSATGVIEIPLVSALAGVSLLDPLRKMLMTMLVTERNRPGQATEHVLPGIQAHIR